MAVTLKEIAKQAGVSATTVSFALRGKQPGKRPLADKTIQRIQEIAGQLGYRPNHLAQSLLGSHTGTLGLLLGNLSFGAEDLLDGVKSVIAPDYSSLLSVYNSDGENERQRLDLFMRQRVDGVIAAFSGDSDSIPLYRDMVELYQIPVVLIDRSIDGLSIPVVRSDHLASTYEGTRALQRLGHRRIRYASVSIARHLESTRLRLEGYCEAMRDAGLDAEIRITAEKDFKEWVRMDNLQNVARSIIDVWAADKERATALFVDNDWLAYEIMEECRTCGVRIPDELSLMGIGDYPFSRFSYVALSTVSSQQQKLMGIAAAELLLKKLRGASNGQGSVILPVEVKLRATTRRL